MNKSRAITLVNFLIILAFVKYAGGQSATGLDPGSIDFIRCINCNERVLFVPFIEYGYVLSGADKYSGKVLVQVEIDDTGNVVWANRISGHPIFGDRIANEVIKARFEPKIEFGLQVASTEILEFEIAANGQELRQVLSIVNGDTESMPPLNYEPEESSRCLRERFEVLIRFNRSTGKVVSARLATGNEIYKDAAETAALSARMRPATDQSSSDFFTDGLLIYQGPNSKKCLIVTSCVISGRAIELVVPKYPAAAVALNLHGLVNVEILIDEEGRVIEAVAKSGHRLFQSAAEQAALESTYFPVKLSGKPVAVRGVIVYNFQKRD